MTDSPPVLPDSPASDAGESAVPEGASGALREVLHQAADRVADYLEGLGGAPIFPTAAAAPEGSPLPDRGEELGALFDDAADWAVANSVHVGHPGYVGHMDSGVAVAGILGDFLASALNQNLLAYELAPGATLLEKKLVSFFAAEAGFDEGAGGLFTTGGTGANLTALLLARDAASRDASRRGLAAENRLCVLASADAHYSLAKACAVIGLGSEQVIQVPVSGPARRMDAAALPALREQAVRDGLRPIAVVATAGSTSCGALDPVDAAADFCEKHGLWLHVDGAHGGALLLHPREKARLGAVHRADSLTLDPHKWLYAPKSAGLLVVRRAEDLVTAHYDAPYLDRFSSHGEALPVSQGRRALDGSRRFDALKVWMLLRHFGRDGLTAILDSRLSLARELHQHLAEHPFFRPCHRPDLNVVAFRPRQEPPEGAMRAVHQIIEAEGAFWPSYTRLDGVPCHRMVLLNPSTTFAHLSQLLERMEEAHLAFEKGRSGPPEALLHSQACRPSGSAPR